MMLFYCVTLMIIAISYKTVKLCKMCKYYINNPIYQPISLTPIDHINENGDNYTRPKWMDNTIDLNAKCGLYQKLTNAYTNYFISENTINHLNNYEHCYAARYNEDMCGVSGKMYKEKQINQ